MVNEPFISRLACVPVIISSLTCERTPRGSVHSPVALSCWVELLDVKFDHEASFITIQFIAKAN